MPDRCARALDVGCGEGTLARELRRRVPHVTAIDRDAPTLEIARRHDPATDIDYVLGDFMTIPLPAGEFDLIVSVAALHHMDAEGALTRMRELLAPGGTLAILGLARSRYPADLPRDIAAVAVHRVHRTIRGQWSSPAPVICPPPHTYAEIRSITNRLLPDAEVRRRLLWRYSLIWRKAAA